MNLSLSNQYMIYELTPCIKVLIFTIIIVVALFAPTRIEKWLDDGIAKHYFGLVIFSVILLLAVLAPFKIQKGLEDISKQNTAQKHLDKHSLLILEKQKGLMFGGEEYDISTLRHLINLELIEFVLFPSEHPTTWGYYLTDLGRYVLYTKLNRTKLYPQDFCAMIRVSYWEGYWQTYPKRFRKEKDDFKKYKRSWDESWKVFDKIIRKKEPNHSEEKAITIFERYLPKNSFDTIMKDLISHWEEETERLNINIICKIINWVWDLLVN